MKTRKSGVRAHQRRGNEKVRKTVLLTAGLFAFSPGCGGDFEIQEWQEEREELASAAEALLVAPGTTSPSLEEWAFAWTQSSTADHTSPSDYSRTSNGNVQADIDHVAAGNYRVTFPGVGTTTGGNLVVSAYGGNNRRCKVGSWSSSSTGLVATVYCFAPSGSLQDTQFTIAYHMQHSYNFGETAYLRANEATNADYVPSETFQYNSNGALNRIQRLGTGNYRVYLPGLTIPVGNAQVSAYGSGPEYCKVRSIGRRFNDDDVPLGREIDVGCYNTAGAAVDTQFTLHYQTMGTSLGTSGAWTRANQPGATSEYSAEDNYTEHDSCGADGSVDVRIARVATGQYRVHYPRTRATLATSLATAFGSNSNYCKVRQWASSGDGTDVFVDCYNASGQPTNDNFMSHLASARSCPTNSDVALAVTGPIDSDGLHVERIGPEYRNGPAMDRVSAFVRLTNNGSSSRFLERIDIGGVPVAWYLDPPEIRAGRSITVQNASSDETGDGLIDMLPLILPLPHAANLDIEAFFTDGTRARLTSPTLTAVTNDGGPLLFTGNAFDLRANETWSSSSNHPSGHQVFALDMGVLGWDGNAFSHLLYAGADPDQKNNFRIYGLPLYAMADGEVCYALNDHTERSFPDTDAVTGSSPTRLAQDPNGTGYNGGGNEVFVKSGDEIAVYAHMQPGSIPPELLVRGARVRRGQYIGKAGLSGSTTGPHTHIHVKSAPAGVPNNDVVSKYGCDSGTPLPMHFQSSKTLPLRYANEYGAAGTLDDGDFTTLAEGSFPHPYGLMMPTQRSLDFDRNRNEGATYFGVYQSSSDIEMRVKSDGWNDFTARWDTLSRDGFRLFEVETVVEDGTRKFLGLFRRGNFGHSLIALSGYSNFRTEWLAQRNNGMRLVDIEAYNTGSTENFIGVFQADATAQDFRVAEGWDAFTSDFGQRYAAGYRLVDVASLPGSNGRRYFGVYRFGGPAQNLFGVPGWSAFAALYGEQTSQQMRLAGMDVYREGSQEHFVGVFSAGNQGIHLKRMSGYGMYVAESEASSSVGLRAVSMVALDD